MPDVSQPSISLDTLAAQHFALRESLRETDHDVAEVRKDVRELTTTVTALDRSFLAHATRIETLIRTAFIGGCILWTLGTALATWWLKR